ncbi:Rho GTPase-activating protein 22 [Saguinus oedipus]|uniref:Rho GTPase-activating protein 22 n=1 Tax=Saguinus oedipus TaxID=9490 RepID=A0ABQ9UMK1_SAGOE|nr:Rho GTPase-activating protein 22 [Saguinus oedipus]
MGGAGAEREWPLSASLPAGTSLIQHLMTVLIRKHSQLFTEPSLEGPTSTRGGQQCAVGWGSEENRPHGAGEPVQPWEEGADPAQLEVLIPAAGGGSSSLEVPIISSGGNWLMNGLSSLRGHRRASSGDRLKDSGSVQRLSTYDNVPPAGLHGVSSAGGSLSSCTACRASDSSRSSLHTEWALEPSPLPSSSEDPKSLDLGHSVDEAGTGSPTREYARRSEALQGLLCRQRTEYERSVKR